MNPTIQKFGYPKTLVQEFDHWVVLLRPQQSTLGALVLACKDAAGTFSEISPGAFKELKLVTAAIEKHLATTFTYDKINYLMLMMVDPDVHFHVIPRYAATRKFHEIEFSDPGWPGPPDLKHVNVLEDQARENLLNILRRAFAGD